MSFSLVTTSWFRLTFPLLLLLMIALGVNNVTSLIEANSGVSTNLPYVLFASVILLSHVFKQSRCGMIATVMLVAYWVVQHRLQSPLSTGTTLLELSLLGILLPICCFIVYCFNDNSLRSRGYLIFVVTLSLMGLWSKLILTHFAEGGFSAVNDSYLQAVTEISLLPFLLVLYLSSLTLVAAIRVLKANLILDAIIYSAMLTASATFIFFDVAYISSTLFSVSGILLLVYLMSASYELAFNDRLTNIPGRLALESDLKHLGRKFTIAMLDIDHFKSFNDTYGHDTGDDVLKLVASKLTETGGKASVYRYGGEEFTVLFKGKYVDDALEYLEELRESIASYEMVVRNNASRPKDDKAGSKQRGKNKATKTVSLTVSIGACDSSEDRKVENIIKAADEALYKAKKGGRNRVVAA
ncbi:GGDEF domain-containing protein [Vibrio intestinalis]|uniref:GGDEF domain-containing protein n=1 Tax=Vibrio intestinalis TaxID=2933291 RepID=UPI0021A6EFAF|nr:GGDEF domain-containing protein [Vibrio intestinalis]